MATTKNNKVTFDLASFGTLFEDKSEECKKDFKHINDCKSVKRLIYALKYYQTSNTKTDKITQSIFTDFIQNIYPYFLNDAIHLKTTHEQNLFAIYQAMINDLNFKECDPFNCQITGRHSDPRTQNRNESQFADNIFRFYQDTFDSLHFYLLHMFQMGLRFVSDDIDENKQNNDTEEKNDDFSTCFDAEFAKRKKVIASKRKIMADFFARFETETNKFNIDVANDDNDDSLYLDILYENLQTVGIKDNQLHTLQIFITTEEYDSDAVMADLHHQEHVTTKQSNILNAIHSIVLRCEICLYVKSQRVSSTSFSTGFTFFYWPAFNPDSKEYAFDTNFVDVDVWSNVNDFGGYSAADLYVPQGKHSNLKEEILDLDDDQITNTEYEMAALKAEKYITSNRAKKCKAKSGNVIGGGKYLNFYNVPEDQAVSTENLMVLILYCDYTKVCAAFSETFRRKWIKESISSVKKRNQKYWWMSKILRETVEIFGRTGHSGDTSAFFCGMSCNMEMPAFSIRLCGPTSTTKHLAVSMNFAKNTGIIIELSNKYFAGGLAFARYYDVSWLSKYVEEDERLWVGGNKQIQIRGIRNTATLQNFSKFFHALFWFDAGLSGASFSDGLGSKVHFRQKDKKFVCSLIDFQLGYTSDFACPKYIKDTFHSFYIILFRFISFCFALCCFVFEKLKNYVFGFLTF